MLYMIETPLRFQPTIAALNSLQELPRYESAFIYGSVAQGAATEDSDLDVQVITAEDNDCVQLNHPVFTDEHGELKLDIVFRSFQQVLQSTEDEVARHEREPRLALGKIIFDRTGELTSLQKWAQEITPPKYGFSDYQHTQFTLYHTTEKARRSLKADPFTSLYSMHDTLSEVLKEHFKIHGHWWVGGKNVLRRLGEWDGEMADLVKQFVATADPKEKFSCWQAIIDHIAAPIGGLWPISEMNCSCRACIVDLATLKQRHQAVKASLQTI
jgi:predicted nucleotidyltransferase